MSYLIDTVQLRQLLVGRHADLIVADCRSYPGRPGAGRLAYEEGHIPGALHVDLEKDLSAPAGKHGGNLPLPDADSLALRLGELGFDRTVPVVVYDEQGGAAARLWWLLCYLGHANVRLLNGGIYAWKAQGLELETEAVPRRPSRFDVAIDARWGLLDAEGVKARLGRPGVLLVDSRDAARYAGIGGEADPRAGAAAGHIPGAVHYFWKDVMTDTGLWKDAKLLADHFAAAPMNSEIVVYCGSGVTACPNVLALKEAGYADVKLYAGGWSDWVSYEGNPVAMGEV